MEHYNDKRTVKEKFEDFRNDLHFKVDGIKRWGSDHPDHAAALGTAAVTGIFSVVTAVVAGSKTSQETRRIYDPVNKVYVVPKRRLKYDELQTLSKRGKGVSVAECLKGMKLIK